jgi:hypothetical protein
MMRSISSMLNSAAITPPERGAPEGFHALFDREVLDVAAARPFDDQRG